MKLLKSGSFQPYQKWMCCHVMSIQIHVRGMMKLALSIICGGQIEEPYC